MLLVFDIANTNIKIGMFDGKKLKATWRIATSVQRTADEYAVILRNLLKQQGLEPGDIKEGAMSCVVPPLVTTFNDLFQRYFKIKPLVVGPGVKTGVRIRYPNPREVGADLIANAAAALSLYELPIIVVALGTATAFATVSKDGYLGGVIAPGLGIAAEALYTRAAALPRVELAKPKQAIGNSTQAAMQSGLIYGWAGLIEGIVGRIEKELGEKATVVATGGYADIIAKETKAIDEVNPNLTLIGIKVIHDMNRE